MNKGELVDSIYDYVDRKVSKKDITLFVSSVFDTIARQVVSGEKVTIVGFGTFEKRERKARQGRNPSNGEVMDIPATSVPAFSAGKNFKEMVAGE